jgi:putative iron-regulated protein
MKTSHLLASCLLACATLHSVQAQDNASAQASKAATASTTSSTTNATTAAANAAPTVKAVVAHYSAVVHLSYSQSLDSAKALDAAISAFTSAPSASTLEAARKAWLQAREAYGQTEAFRFYSGPIDDGKGPEGRINAWPIDESFIDKVSDKPGSGLVNNKKFSISAKTLDAQNERGGEENIATGWHAIEFLLWGQDLSETGPGNRSFEDFVDGKAPNAERRRQYLSVISQMLVTDLGSLVQAWAPNAKGNYRTKFEQGGLESVRKIIVGLGSLSRGELAGQRLEVALNSKDQEDEHSCFSDNTHRDIVNNAQGVANVWLGSYTRADGSQLSGPALRDLVAAKDAALADKLTQTIRASVQSAQAIVAPFDREITGDNSAPGRQRIQKTIDSLSLQSRDLVSAATVLGIAKLKLQTP